MKEYVDEIVIPNWPALFNWSTHQFSFFKNNKLLFIDDIQMQVLFFNDWRERESILHNPLSFEGIKW